LFVNETNNLRKNCRGAYKEASTSIYDKKKRPEGLYIIANLRSFVKSN